MSKMKDKDRIVFSMENSDGELVEIMAYTKAKRRNFRKIYRKRITIWNGSVRRAMDEAKKEVIKSE